MRYVRIVAFNVVLLLCLLFLVELGLRSFWFFRSCSTASECESRWLTKLQVKSLAERQSKKMGLAQAHTELGYVPAPGFDQVIETYGWNRKRVTIGEDGFRGNGNRHGGPKRILVVGDSFTFGDQVGNEETWPSCIERQLGVGVANGGVFNYGAAQSVRRAQIEASKKEYDLAILSIFIEGDFGRDQLSFRDGFPRPAVISDATGLRWESPPDPLTRGSVWNPDTNEANRTNRVAWAIYENSAIAATLVDGFSSGDLGYGRLSSKHPAAASIDQIIGFTIEQFSQVPVQQKLVLFQYSKHLNRLGKVVSRRETALAAAKNFSIPVVDTLDMLSGQDATKLWDGHHTPEGNRKVCEVLLADLGKSGFAASAPKKFSP